MIEARELVSAMRAALDAEAEYEGVLNKDHSARVLNAASVDLDLTAARLVLALHSALMKGDE